MKTIVVSDIHGANDSIDALESATKFHNITNVICCGDFLYHGPRNPLPNTYDPKTVASRLNDMHINITAVRGNCDAEVDQMVLAEYDIMETYKIINLNDKKLCLTHGHIYNPDNLVEDTDIILYGHTHIPVAKKDENGIIVLNPGSITLPKENHPRTYAVLEDDKFTIYTLDHKVYMQLEF